MPPIEHSLEWAQLAVDGEARRLSNLEMLKRADQHALGANLRIFEAEFFLVRSQMPAVLDWQSISALTKQNHFTLG